MFAILATANGAGYRYGGSDQAFYIPAVARALQPDAFPRDAALIDSQGRLMLADDLIAGIVRATGLPIDVLFLAAYLLSLLLVWTAITLIGHRLYSSAWLTVALAAAFTLRHQIPRTSANSFEPYFHPRVLAFACGALAVAALLRRRFWVSIAMVAVAAIVHITTALWFAVLIGTAILMLDRTFHRPAIAGVIAAVAFLVWAAMSGMLADAFDVMDAAWLTAVAGKDYLFASNWPLWAWAANLALLPVAWAAHSARRRRGAAGVEERALLWGATALVMLFLATLPLVLARVALPVQLQISRVFWLVDFVALLLVIGVARSGRAVKVLAMVLAAVAIGRGLFILTVEYPERPLFAVHLPASAWGDAMQWLKTRPLDTHVLADPEHAGKYGTSVRVSAERDVFLEQGKDAAIAIYSRDVAQRVVERSAAAADFDQMTPERAHDLARRYGLDYLVTEADLALPVAYRNQRFVVYSLREP